MNEVVVVIGASGGLGQAAALAFARRGAQLALVGRQADRLQAVAKQLPAGAEIITADVTDDDSVQRLSQMCEERFGRVDVVVNAAGTDVRAAFEAHTPANVQQLLNTNLLGAIWITRAFLPWMVRQHSGIIVHLGGFGDGRLAFPYYTVDSATRAGLRGFVDAINREYEGSGVTVTFFCPAPADTQAERPYHPLWRSMGMSIAAPEQVARELLQAVDRRQPVYIMGFSTRLFAWVNSLSSALADWLLMRRYRLLLRRFLTESP